MPEIKDIFDAERIKKLLLSTKNPTKKRIEEILAKAEKMKGLSLEDAASLINAPKKYTDLMFKTAWKIKKEIYGERIVLFAPLYVSNYCVNDCEYCGFHIRNKEKRIKLSLKQVEQQTRFLINMGHKRLLLEFGEHPKMCPIDYVVDTIKTIYSVKEGNGSIRRVNVNIAATTVEDYKKLKKAGIGTYQLFQETYHQPTYAKLHNGPKADFERQLFAHIRAFKAGIDDVGLGVLFGLYDWRFDTLALLSHAQYLDKTFGVGPHTFSVPRLQPAPTVKEKWPYAVNENELLKIIAILRMSVPYTGMIISTRERPNVREKAFKLGISQTSAASCTSPGGYGKKRTLNQFQISDERSLDKVIEGIIDKGLLPSFCTACYRIGRTGKDFMDIAKPGEIHNFCRPNAILTLKEYLEDYAKPLTKEKGLQIIQKYLKLIPSKVIQKKTVERLARIERGQRDLYF
ncbi:[FeFe] hydrogenase H-cluster radical SAM maturase HydG [Candidatus Peregrinibacteria bacterium]|nr:[FeFe] hydrogenase H-cluster radical SAM maturase HydG [Candidatus Peregrinibacteria bacterium]